MSLEHIAIHPKLKGYVEKIFVLKTAGRVPNPDLKIIVPNSCAKLVIPVGNGLTAQRAGYVNLSKPDRMTLVGIADTPFTVDPEFDSATTVITVEFSPIGSYLFFRFRQSELKNQIVLVNEVLGKRAKDLEDKIADAQDVETKISLLQRFLVSEFTKHNSRDTIFEFCVSQIRLTKGSIRVNELEVATGYSSRWLNMKFDERLGLSVKTLSAITRFMTVFETLANKPATLLNDKSFYNIYYDQSHFIKEFKRFTGMPPKQFESKENYFSKIFYRE